MRLLPGQKFVLAGDRQLRQRCARGDGCGLHTLQQVRKSRAGRLGMGNLQRQGCHQGGFTLMRAAGFKGVVMQAHGEGQW